MKGWKRIVVILCAVLAAASLAACGLGDSTENVSAPLSSAGKCLIHSAGASTADRMLNTTPQDDFLEAMAEAATPSTRWSMRTPLDLAAVNMNWLV